MSQLKKNLLQLPKPKNDYEIVVPEEEEAKSKKSNQENGDEEMDDGRYGEQFEIADQSDLDAKTQLLLKEKRELF